MKTSLFLALAAASLACSCSTQPNPGWEGRLHSRLDRMAARLTATLQPWTVPDRVVRVEDFGAVADGQTLNSAAINRAIEACSTNGGGVVLLSRGDYVSGTIDLKSGVMLEVAAGARLLGSTNIADYPDRVARRRTVMDSNMDMRQSLIFAEGCQRIGIRGAGVIDGRGSPRHFPGRATTGRTPGRPFLLRVIDCRQVVMDGITLKDAPCWMENYLNCEDLILQHLKVENQANGNNDGIDIDGCRNVIVRGCFINSEDDGMCFKGASLRPMENVLVEDCKFYSTCNAIKFGTDSQGDFRDVLVRNVEAGGPSADMRNLRHRRAISGISWEAVDGGTVENVIATNVHIVRAESPLFLRLGDRGRVLPEMPKPGPGTLRRVVFEHITGEDNGARGSVFTGIPAGKIRDVVVRYLRLSMAGGGQMPAKRVIPEKPADYPESAMFGPQLPAHGFWVRHAQNVRFIDVHVTPQLPDARPEFSDGGDTQDITVDGKPW
jgi:polygalacturonase